MYSPSVAIPRVSELLYGHGRKADVDVIIGCGCSVVCEPVGYVARDTNTPMISFGCISNILSDKSIYPTFARTTGTNTMFAPVYASAVKSLNFKRVAIFSGGESFFAALSSMIMTQMAAAGITVTDFITLPGFASRHERKTLTYLTQIWRRCKGEVLVRCKGYVCPITSNHFDH